MPTTNDAELQELFRQEINERVARLVEGALAMEEGKLTGAIASTMYREGHTIKGTARVMGYEAISLAGQHLEQRWRQIQDDDDPGTPALGKALGDLAAAILPAVDADPDRGTAELVGALSRLNRVEANETAIALRPEGDTDVSPDPQAAPEDHPEASPRIKPTPDLGGLLGALDTWASEEFTRVNAAQLYRLINTVAAVGVETRGVRQLLLDLSDAIPTGSPAEEQVWRLAEAVESIEASLESAKDHALALASTEIAEVTNTFPQLVRYLARKVGKEIRFEMIGDEARVDRQVLEKLADPLRQLIVNAVEHGVEPASEREADGKAPTATLAVRARTKDYRLEITVEDDGRGVDWEAVHRTAVRRGLLPEGQPAEAEALRSLLLAPGFSTASQSSELVGDGSGLTTVADAVEALHGSFRFETEPGAGTRVTLAVPTSRALQDAVLVRAAGQNWGIPEAAIIDSGPLNPADIEATPNRQEMMWRSQRIPVASFAGAVGLGEGDEAKQYLVLASPVGPVALTVPEVVGRQQVAAKELGPLLGGSPHLTGAALLGGGDVVVLVDPARVAERVREVPVQSGDRPTVLVVDDSQGVRQVVAAALASSGFDTAVAAGSEEALEVLEQVKVDAMVVDFSMPGSDGVALVLDVRARYGRLPIVMLSGVATQQDQARARQAGVDAYFDKADFREGALAVTLRSLVEERTEVPA